MTPLEGLGQALDAAVHNGHDASLCQAYYEIAEHHASDGKLDSACFFWTQALVFALCAGDAEREATLRERLAAHGRV
ncbi:MAG: hypothetical protein AAF499_11825 [Pseudomonadota bacterium]